MVEKRSTVLVVGYNARPIAASAKRLGLNVLVVDYWGDADLYKCADEILVVRKLFKETGLGKGYADLFLELAKKFADNYSIDFVLVGSGFDDEPRIWDKLNEIAPVIGNGKKALLESRDKMKVFSEAKKLGISFPDSTLVKDVEDAKDAAKSIGLPVIVRPTRGGGGQGIQLARSLSEVERIFEGLSDQKMVMVQEYIRGVDASCSLLSSGRSALAISVNEQLIGLSELGAKDFVYCGNIVPLTAKREVCDKIKMYSEALCKLFSLRGSNGVDFVIRADEPYLMEINPRFQGTLECVEMVTGLNIVEAHIRACDGILPECVPPRKGYAVKNILFAKHDFIMPQLGIPSVFDITMSGTFVKAGTPVCTIQLLESKKEEALLRARKIAEQIYSQFEKSKV